MGWFDMLFPIEANQAKRLQEQVNRLQQKIERQERLIARMHTTLIYLRAENAVLSKSGESTMRKVERFQMAAAAILRDKEKILQSTCATTEHFEAIQRADDVITQKNYVTVIRALDVQDAIFAFEMWADIPSIGQLLLAYYILSMG